MFNLASSSPGTSLKKSTPHTMSTLHEEQHSDNDDDAKGDAQATPECHVETSKASQKEEPESEASQVRLFHFFKTFSAPSRAANFSGKFERKKTLFYLNRFITPFFCIAWQSNGSGVTSTVIL